MLEQKILKIEKQLDDLFKEEKRKKKESEESLNENNNNVTEQINTYKKHIVDLKKQKEHISGQIMEKKKKSLI